VTEGVLAMLTLAVVLALTLASYVALTVLRRRPSMRPLTDLGYVSERWLAQHRADHHVMR
jgi:hypothetical protein